MKKIYMSPNTKVCNIYGRYGILGISDFKKDDNENTLGNEDVLVREDGSSLTTPSLWDQIW